MELDGIDEGKPGRMECFLDGGIHGERHLCHEWRQLREPGRFALQVDEAFAAGPGIESQGVGSESDRGFSVFDTGEAANLNSNAGGFGQSMWWGG